jgi:hypothetical protein
VPGSEVIAASFIFVDDSDQTARVATASSCGTLEHMAIQLNSDFTSCEHVERHQQNDQRSDLDHIAWIANNIDLVSPFAGLEARLDRALKCTSFTAQMAAMEDSLNIDPTKLPPALYAKWDRLLTRIAETTFFGQCAPLER